MVQDEEMGEGVEGELESKGVKKFWGGGSRDETSQASCGSYLFPLDCCYPALIPRGQTLCLRLLGKGITSLQSAHSGVAFC